MTESLRLHDGSRVAIVGGGPAGCFSALHLLRFAAQAGLSIEVTILEPRDFNQPGPGGCNKCAGILSANLIRNMETLDLHLPPDVVQSEIDSYILHAKHVKLPIHRPDPSYRIVSVYRGGGPRLGSPPAIRSFDEWLLEQARKSGADIQRMRVQKIVAGPKPVIITARQEFTADLIILATGMNTRAPLDQSWGYNPPLTEIMAQDEVLLPVDFPNNNVSIFFDHPPGLIFGALIPKGRYANISLLGHKMPLDAINAFLEGHGLVDLFSNGGLSLCGCTPRVAVSMASNFYADRLAVVGDAAVTRLYKDGIGAAFLTAEAVARTAIQRGVSRKDFTAGYLPVCRRIASDNRYGRWLFRIWSIIRQSPFLLNAWHRTIQVEDSLPSLDHVYTRVLWGMFTGSESYRKLFLLSISRNALSGLWKGAWFNRSLR
jgi:flavin-dependent dehydrogenase